jgi:hypothetical protein
MKYAVTLCICFMRTVERVKERTLTRGSIDLFINRIVVLVDTLRLTND